MSKIFGGSKSVQKSSQSSVSGNKAFPEISQNLGPSSYGAYNQGLNQFGSEVGGGFEKYKDNINFDFLERLGLRNEAGRAAGGGTFQSGDTLKGLAEYQGNLQQMTFQSYLDNLLKQAQLGLGGAAAVGSAGQYSQSSGTSSGTSTSNPGIGSFLGSIASAVAASDRRLKRNVEVIGSLPNSELTVYRYQYNWDDKVHIGVMADEVREKLPEALGPSILGYDTVDYSVIKKVG